MHTATDRPNADVNISAVAALTYNIWVNNTVEVGTSAVLRFLWADLCVQPLHGRLADLNLDTHYLSAGREGDGQAFTRRGKGRGRGHGEIHCAAACQAGLKKYHVCYVHKVELHAEAHQVCPVLVSRWKTSLAPPDCESAEGTSPPPAQANKELLAEAENFAASVPP
jgi:hypothetical protein